MTALARAWSAGTAAALAALIVVAGVPAAASAHDALVASTPAEGQKVTSVLPAVSLTFNEDLLDVSGTGNAFAIQLRGPDGRYYEAGCPTLAQRSITAPMRMGGPGLYTVVWQIISQDGHATSDSYDFTYAPPAGSKASFGYANPVICRDGAATRVLGTSTPEASKPSSSGNLQGVAIGIGVAILALIAAGIVLVLIRRRTPTDT